LAEKSIDTEIITTSDWEAQAIQVEVTNLVSFSESPDATQIMRHAHAFIVTIQPDLTMVVRKGWREAMQQCKPRFWENAAKE
jgi:hypothetical protein